MKIVRQTYHVGDLCDAVDKFVEEFPAFKYTGGGIIVKVERVEGLHQIEVTGYLDRH